MAVRPDLAPHQGEYPPDTHFRRHGDTTLCTYVSEHHVPKTYEVVGETINPGVMSFAEVAVIEGTFVHVVYERGYIKTYHPFGGRNGSYEPDGRLETPALLLEQLPAPVVEDHNA